MKTSPVLSEGRPGRSLASRSAASWRSGVCSFVGDAKYRNYGGSPDAQDDLYQLLAYVVGSGLTGGMLIYASGGHAEEHTITKLDRTLRIATLDLSGTPHAMLAQVDTLATRISAISSSQPALL